MAGSHRASRGGARAAAREARRQRARKRNQLIGAVAAGVLVLGAGGVVAVNALGGGSDDGGKTPGDDRPAKDSAVLQDQKVLVDGAVAKSLAPAGAWAVTGTADGSSASEKSFVCQAQRFADPAGIRTWVRTLQNATAKDTAVQYVEVSNDAAAATKAYNTVIGWLGQCNTPQVRLVSSWSVSGLGDRGLIAVFGLPPGGKVKYRTVAVTAAGQATMVLQHDSAAAAQPEPSKILAASSAAVKRFCGETGGCSKAPPKLRSNLLPTTEPDGFMAPVDLPVLSKVNKPWVSAQATTRPGTGCERMDLDKAKASKHKTQTYVTPEADVPTEFGLDSTVVRFGTPAAAKSFVEDVRENVDDCEKEVSNAEVKSTGEIKTSTIHGETWRAEYDTGGGKITYRIGIAVSGQQAVYLLFPVLKTLDITDTAFTQTLTRAAERSTTFK